MRAAILLAFEVKARNIAKNVEPDRRIATNLDLRLDRTKRVERLIEQVAHHAGRWLIAGRADIAYREVVVHAHVALDKTGHLPVLDSAVIAFEDEDVAAAGSPTVAFPPTLVVWMGEGRANAIPKRSSVAGLGGADAIGQTSFFHSASCRTA
jgi:hypothetical protein